jgi:ketosteroid isomerase-like protein
VSPMSNKQIVLEAWKAFRTRSREQIRPLLAPDIQWIAPPGNATATALGKPSGFSDRESMMDFICDDFSRLFVRDVSVDVRVAVCEGEVVILEQAFCATLCNGRSYQNDYVFVFQVRGGQVHQMREYMDTASGFRQIFGDEPARRIV